MGSDVDTLNRLVQSFLTKEINGDTFDNAFATLFDMEEFSDEDIKQYSFQSIRELLEHYTSSDYDLLEYPQYYFDEAMLRERIFQLRILF